MSKSFGEILADMLSEAQVMDRIHREFEKLDPSGLDLSGLEANGAYNWEHEGGIVFKESCKHEWVEYTGLSECFSYCKYCDQKAVSDRK